MHETRAEAHQVEQQKAQEEIATLKQKYFQLASDCVFTTPVSAIV